MMGSAIKTTLPAVAVCCLMGASAPALPEFNEGTPLTASGKTIDYEVGHLVPSVADWNGDGKKDLIVGTFRGGQILFYENTGTDTAPILADAAALEAGGEQISLPAG